VLLWAVDEPPNEESGALWAVVDGPNELNKPTAGWAVDEAPNKETGALCPVDEPKSEAPAGRAGDAAVELACVDPPKAPPKLNEPVPGVAIFEVVVAKENADGAGEMAAWPGVLVGDEGE
jgi:hypothetical protein